MRPNAITIHVIHVRNYLNSLKDSNKTLYSKTQGWLSELRAQLLECCQIITDILGDGQLNDFTETTILSDTETYDPLHLFPSPVVDSDDTEDLSPYSNPQKDVNNVDTDIMQPNIPILNQKPVSTVSPTRNRKHVVHSYGTILHELTESNRLLSDPNTAMCAEILWHWYEIRFFLATTNTSFRYNVRHLPVWIRNIVLVYSKYVELGEQGRFKQTFYDWLSQVQVFGSEESRYGVPYEVHRLDLSTTSDDITVTALKIWDLLWVNGLYKLNDSSLSESRITDEYMYNFCEKYNSKIVDQYEDLLDNQKGAESL